MRGQHLQSTPRLLNHVVLLLPHPPRHTTGGRCCCSTCRPCATSRRRATQSGSPPSRSRPPASTMMASTGGNDETPAGSRATTCCCCCCCCDDSFSTPLLPFPEPEPTAGIDLAGQACSPASQGTAPAGPPDALAAVLQMRDRCLACAVNVGAAVWCSNVIRCVCITAAGGTKMRLAPAAPWTLRTAAACRAARGSRAAAIQIPEDPLEPKVCRGFLRLVVLCHGRAPGVHALGSVRHVTTQLRA